MLHVAYVGAEQEDLGAGVLGLVGGEVFGRVLWEGAEPGTYKDEVGSFIFVGGRGSWGGSWPVKCDFVGYSDGLHCLDGVVVLHFGSDDNELLHYPTPNYFRVVAIVL